MIRLNVLDDIISYIESVIENMSDSWKGSSRETIKYKIARKITNDKLPKGKETRNTNYPTIGRKSYVLLESG